MPCIAQSGRFNGRPRPVASVASPAAVRAFSQGACCGSIARADLTAMIFGNALATMPIVPSTAGLVGTSPIAIAAPSHAVLLIVGFSMSKVPWRKVALSRERRETLPSHWVYDAEDKTTDPQTQLCCACGRSSGSLDCGDSEVVKRLFERFIAWFSDRFSLRSHGKCAQSGITTVAITPILLDPHGYWQCISELWLRANEMYAPGSRRASQHAQATGKGIAIASFPYDHVTRLTAASETSRHG